MRERPIMEFRPRLERFEEKRLLTASPLTPHFVNLNDGSGALALHSADTSSAPRAVGDIPRNHAGVTRLRDSVLMVATDRHRQPSPSAGFTLFRITNPTPTNAILNPPFDQVLVQSPTPVPGAVYNVLSISVRNGTARTFDASSGFSVKFTGQSGSFPILTGTGQWKPGQVLVFYILTKKYYPPNPVTSAGFEFDLAGSRGVAIPGPSGIFLRVKYDPATFPRLLNWIVAHGPGAKGHELGLPDTAIWEFTSSSNYVIPL